MKGQASILLVFCAVTGSLAKPPPTFLEYKDSLGQYSFGYSAPGSARSEVRSHDGSTRGSYSYVDDAGVIQSAQYTADGEHGFQVVATNLPQAPRPVEDTPEVAAARLDHLRAFEEASKLAEENPDTDYQPSEAEADEKSSDTVAIDTASDSADNLDGNRIEAKSTRSAAAADRSAESQIEVKEAIEKVALKIGVSGSENESTMMKEKSGQPESMETVQSLRRAADSSRSNVPVVTTSFVIPGRVNLHSRIELDQSGVPVTRFSAEPFADGFGTIQSSMPQGQGDKINPSMITMAQTKVTSIADSETSQNLNEASRRHAGPAETTISSSIPQPHPGTFSTAIIASPNVYALTYGINVDPIFRQYNPYQYFRYGIL